MAISLLEIRNILHPQKKQATGGTLKILDNWTEYEEGGSTNERKLEYMCYEMESIDPHTGEKQHYYKALKLCRVIRVPKGMKQSTALMDMQTQVMTAVYEQEINFICVIANIREPVALGLLFLYGVQGVSKTLDGAKEKARKAFVGLSACLQGTYRVLETRVINAQETEWLRDKLYKMEYTSVVRGIPKASRTGEDLGNKGMGGANLNPDSQGTLEELITGMADYEYVIEILTTPVHQSTLRDWAAKNRRYMTDWQEQLQGTKGFNFSLSIPMMYGANQGMSQGQSKGYSIADSYNVSQGTNFSQSYGENVGEALSQTYGQSFGKAYGQSFSESISTAHTVSQGVSMGRTVGVSFGQSQGQSFGQNISQSQGTNIGQSTNQSLGRSFGESVGQNQGASLSQNIGQSFGTSRGISSGFSTGQSAGMSSGQSNGISTGQSAGFSTGRSAGYSSGQSAGMSTGQSFGTSNGLSRGFSQGTSTGQSMGASMGQSASFGRGYSAGQSYGVSSSEGRSEGYSVSDGKSVGQSFGSSDSMGRSLGESRTMGQSFGSSENYSEGFNSGSSHNSGSSYGANNGQSMNAGHNIGTNMSEGVSSGRSGGISSSAGTSSSESFNRGTSSSESVNESIGENKGVSGNHGWNNGMNVGENTAVNNTVNATHTDGTTKTDTQTQNYGNSAGVNLNGGGQGTLGKLGVNYSHNWGGAHAQGNGENTADGSSVGYGVNHGTSLGESAGESASIGESAGASYGYSQGTNHGETASVGASNGYNQSAGMNYSENLGRSSSLGNSEGYSAGYGRNIGESYGVNQSIGESQSISNNHGSGISSSYSDSSGYSNGMSETHGTSYGQNMGESHSESYNTGRSQSAGQNWGMSASESMNQSYSQNMGQSYSQNMGQSQSESLSQNVGQSYSQNAGQSYSQNIGQSYSQNEGQSYSQNVGQSYSQNVGQSFSQNVGQSYGQNVGTSQGNSLGVSQGVTQGSSYGQNAGMSESRGTGVSLGQSLGVSKGYSVSTNIGTSQTRSESQSYSVSQSESWSTSHGFTKGESITESQSESVSQGQTSSYGQSKGISQGKSASTGYGQSQSQNIGYNTGITSGASASMGISPSLGYSKSYQWLDQQVKDIVEMLDYKNERLKNALRGNGAFYSYVYIACPSMDALAAAKALAKSTWQNEEAMINPLQVLDLDRSEQQNILTHCMGFSADVSMEDTDYFDDYKYCSVLLPKELVSYTHLPRISEGGLMVEAGDVPKFSVPSMLKGEIYMGTVLSPERYTMQHGYETPFEYRIDERELMHMYFTGASRSGKTVTAMRFIAELSRVRRKSTGKRFRIVCMDPKQDWRALARYVEPERFRFYNMGNTLFRPLHLNPLKIPHGVIPQIWIDGVIDCFCRAYGLLERGKLIMGESIYQLYHEAGVFGYTPTIKNELYSIYKEEYLNGIATDRSSEAAIQAADKYANDRIEREDESIKKNRDHDLISNLSSKVTFVEVYERMNLIKLSMEGDKEAEEKLAMLTGMRSKGKSGNDTKDAYSKLLDRLQAFNREFSVERQLFGTHDGMAVDELIGADDVTVIESKGLENTFKNFIFGVITSGFYKFALAHEGGYLADDQYETLLVIEEANEVLTGSDVAGTGGGANFGMTGQSEFEQILDQSAGYGLFICAITQKISDMPKSIIANAGLKFAGRLTIPDDVTTVIRSIAREDRYEDRDLVKWFPRSPTGWFVCMSSRTYDFKDSEPVLVKIAPLNTKAPTNSEIDELLTLQEMSKIRGMTSGV